MNPALGCFELLAGKSHIRMGGQKRPFPFKWNERFFGKDRN
jgi:hypothetical protein